MLKFIQRHANVTQQGLTLTLIQELTNRRMNVIERYHIVVVFNTSTTSYISI